MKNLVFRAMSVFLIGVLLVVMIPFGVFAKNISEQSKTNGPISDGAYLIKNVTLNRLIQPDNDNLYFDNAELELWNSGDLDYQLWNISNLGNGYYKIVNAYNNKAISVKTGEENQDSSRIIQKSYNGSFSQQWKITITNRGYYKIAPRSGEAYSTDWCMSADDGILFANGWKIEQKEYTDNTYLRDEWCIIPCTTWVEFSYDNGMLQRHKLNNESDDITKARISNTIINDHFSIISLFFENICGVCLNNNQSAALYYLSDADNCSIDLDQHCSDISSCVLRWDDNPYNNNSTNGFQYNAHHKNIIRLRNNLIVGIPDHTIRITYTGHNCCYSDRSGIDSFNVAALSDYDNPIICIKDVEYSDSFMLITMGHELSHTFQVNYHHDSSYNTPCCMGDYDYVDIDDPITFWCSSCRNIISSNRYRYVID